MNELTSCKFIKERRNITMLGNPGRGKTHMTIGLGMKACSMEMPFLSEMPTPCQRNFPIKIIADRGERGSIIKTTNLPFFEWTPLFENTAMVAAIIDRLTFQDMNGESYRLAKNSIYSPYMCTSLLSILVHPIFPIISINLFC